MQNGCAERCLQPGERETDNIEDAVFGRFDDVAG
jgi:hypothetical protein